MEVATAVCHKSIKKYQEALSEVHRLDGRIAEMVDTLPYFKQELPSGIVRRHLLGRGGVG